MLTRLLKADNVCDIGHVDSTFQLKTGPSSSIQRGFIFLHHELCLLLVRVEILAAEKNSLKKVDVVLRKLSTRSSFAGNDRAQATYLSFIILAAVSLHHLEGAKPKKISKGIHLQSLPVIHTLGKINYCRSQMLLMNGLIGKVKH